MGSLATVHPSRTYGPNGINPKPEHIESHQLTNEITMATNPTTPASIVDDGSFVEKTGSAQVATPKTPSLKTSRSEVSDFVTRRATELGVDPALAQSIILQESGGNPNVGNSPKGARGVAQVMPGTYKMMMGSDAGHENWQNSAEAGLRYLKYGMRTLKTSDPALLAAGYHAGYDRADLKAGKIPGTNDGMISTADYAKSVTARLGKTAQQGGGIDDDGQFSPKGGAASGIAIPDDGEFMERPAGKADDFDDASIAAQQKAIDDKPLFDYLKGKAVGGFDDMTQALEMARWAVAGGDNEALAAQLSKQLINKSKAPKTTGEKEIDDAFKEVTDANGAWDTTKKGAKALYTAITNPKALAGEVVGQSANSLPTMGAGAAGAGTGAGVGALAGAPAGGVGAVPGAIAGAFIGGRAGMAAGTTVTELGAEVTDMIGKRLEEVKQPPTAQNILAILNDKGFQKQALEQGLKKGLTVAAVDQVFLVIGGKIATAPAKKAATKILAEEGVDVSTAAARKTALASPAGRAAVEAAKPSIGARVGAGAAATAVDSAGEVLGEGLSQKVARGEVDYGDALREGVASLGQSVVEPVIGGAMESGKAAVAAARAPAQPAPIQQTPNAPSTASGPLARAAENAAVQPDRVTATAPDGSQVTGTVTGTSEDGKVQIVDDNGEIVTFQTGPNGVQIEQEAPNTPLTNALEVAAGDQPDAAPVEAAAPEQVEQPAPAVAAPVAEQPKAPEAPKLSDMDEPALRERLKYIADQAKTNGGWNKMLVEQRRLVEREINKRTAEKETAPTQQPSQQTASDKFDPQGLQPGTPEYNSAVDNWVAEQDAARTAAENKRQRTENKKAADTRNGWRKRVMDWFNGASEGDTITTEMEGEEYRVVEKEVTRGGKKFKQKLLVLVKGRGDTDLVIAEHRDGNPLNVPNTELGIDEDTGSAQPETDTDSRAASLGQLLESGKAKTKKAEKTAAAPQAAATLPKELSGAKPRYNFGNKAFELNFASDLDKAAYIAAQDKPSKRDAEYLAHAMAAGNMTEEEVRAHGRTVREAIKAQARDASSGSTLKIAPIYHAPKESNATQTNQTQQTEAQRQEAPEVEPAPAKPKTESKIGPASLGSQKADMDHLFGVDAKRAKAMERIEAGKAWFADGVKAKDFITKNGLKDTHEVKQGKGGRFDVVAKAPDAGSAGSTKNATSKTTSWVIKDKATGAVVMETFDPKKVEALNTVKYEAVPALEHLQSLNGKKESKPERQYDVVAINEKTGAKTVMTKEPVPHKEAVTIKSKISDNPARRIQLEEAKSAPVQPEAKKEREIGGYPVSGLGDKALDTVVKKSSNADDVAAASAELQRRIEPEAAKEEVAEQSLPADKATQLQEAHRAHGRDVKRSTVVRAISREKGNNTGAPKARRERAEKIKRLESDLALFDQAARDRKAAGTAVPNSQTANAEPTAPVAEEKLTVSPLVQAMNDLAEVRQRIADQGQVVDDRLLSRERQLKALVKELESDGQNDELDAEMRSYEAKAVSTYSGQPGPAPEATPDPFSGNKIFTTDAVAKARARLKSKLGQLNSGIDPEMVMDGMTIAGAYIESGTRTFAAYAKAMVEDLGDQVKPYLLSFYEAARHYPGVDSDGMSSPSSARAQHEALMLDAAETSKVKASKAPAEPETKEQVNDTQGNDADYAEPLDNELPQGNPELAQDVAPETSASVREPNPAGDGRADRSGSKRRTGMVRGAEPVLHGPTAEVRPLDNGPLNRTSDTPNQLPGGGNGNYQITEDDKIGEGSKGQKLRNNMAAIRTLRQIQKEGRAATPAEQATMAKFVGWGGLRELVDTNTTGKQWLEARAELLGTNGQAPLLVNGDKGEDWIALQRSTTAAHYTAPEIVKAMWSAVEHFGFNGGRALEPTSGIGNFIGLQPQNLAASTEWHGAELDTITGQLAKLIYPEAAIHAGTGFESVPFAKGAFDLAIGNPPFGSLTIKSDVPAYAHIPEMRIHNYIIAKTGEHLRPGGVMAMVVTHRFLDTANPEAREYLAKSFKFLGAFRLPNDAFAANAGTEVVTDVLFLQKLRDGEKPAPQAAWLDTEGKITVDGQEIRVNRYYQANPNHILGRSAMDGTLYAGRGEAEYTVHSDGRDLSKSIEDIVLGDWSALKDVAKPTNADQDVAAVMLTQSDMPIGGVVLDESGKIMKREMDDEAGNAVIKEVTPDTLWKDGAEQWQGIEQAAKALRDGKNFSEAAKEFAEASAIAYTAKGEKRPKPTKAEQAVYDIRDSLDAPAYRWSHDAQLAEIGNTLGRKKLGADSYQTLKGLLGLRAATLKLITAEMKNAPDMEALRTALNKEYDAFVAKHGYVSDPSNANLLDGDVGVESGLEAGFRPKNGKTKASANKSDIFSQRVNFPYKEVTSAKDAHDGLQISMSERGRLDIGYIAGLTGQSKAQVITELSTGDSPSIFFDPATNEYEDADSYLSGNVKRKLDEARANGLAANIKALEAVQPTPKTRDNVKPNIRGSWMPEAVFEQFLTDIGVQSARANIIASQGMILAQQSQFRETEFGAQFKSGIKSVVDIFNSASSGKPITIWVESSDGKRVKNEAATKEVNLLVERMAKVFEEWAYANDDRVNSIVDAFNEKMNTHIPRKYDGNKYLKTVGANPSIALRTTQKNAAWRMVQADTVLLDHVVGAGKTFTIITGVKERKRLGLSRKPLIVVPNHLVTQWAKDFYALYPGAKVLAATPDDFAAKKRKRMFSRIATGDYDAVIIGHSSMGFIPAPLEDQQRVINENISELQEVLNEMRAKKESGRTITQIQERLQKYEGKLKDLMDGKKDDIGLDLESMGIDYIAVDEMHEFKNLEYSSAGERVVGMNDPKGSKKAFDLYIKIRGLLARGGAVTGATGTPVSNSLVELYTMMKYLAYKDLTERSQSNFDAWSGAYTRTENKLEYTATQKLKPRRVLAGLNNLSALKQVYESFADVISMDDLKRIYSEDVRAKNKKLGTNERTEFPVPKVEGGKRVLDAGPITQAQSLYMDYLVARMNAIDKNKSNKEYASIDNALYVLTDARKMSLDIRIVDPTAPRDENGKVARAAERIKGLYDKWDAYKGTQMVFCDLSTPAKNAVKEAKALIRDSLEKIVGAAEAKRIKGRVEAQGTYINQWRYIESLANDIIDNPQTDPEVADKTAAYLASLEDVDATMTTADVGFSVYDDLRQVLIDKGIPEREVAFIHDYNTPEQKAKLFQAVNDGEIRVLLGSSAKMGAGTNAQQRLVGLHHMDAPWRPSDVEQREGRIIRQGNGFYGAIHDFGVEKLPADIRAAQAALKAMSPNGFEVSITAYSTNGTSDAVMWQVLERKAKAIEEFRSTEMDSTDEDEGDANQYAEFMAQSTGNPVFKLKLEAEREVDLLDAETRGVVLAKSQAKQFMANYDRDMASATAMIKMATGANVDSVSVGKESGTAKEFTDVMAAADAKYTEEYAKYLEKKEAANKALDAWNAQLEMERGDKPKMPTAPAKPGPLSKQVLEGSGYARAIKAALEKATTLGSHEFKVGNIEVRVRKSPVHETFWFLDINNGSAWQSYESADAIAAENSPKLAMALSPENLLRMASSIGKSGQWSKSNLESQRDAKEKLATRDIGTEKLEKAKKVAEWYKAQVGFAEQQADEIRGRRMNSYIAGDRKRPLQQFKSEPKEPKPVQFEGETYNLTGYVSGNQAQALDKSGNEVLVVNGREDKIEKIVTKPQGVEFSGIKKVDDAAFAEKGAVTDTPEFKAWFGDSKVVDAQGKPLVVYHGTARTSIDKFSGHLGVAGHFAFDPEKANGYADDRYTNAQDNGTDIEYGDGAVIYPVYISAKNIFDLRKKEHADLISAGPNEGYETLESSLDTIKAAGFDAYYDFDGMGSSGAPDGIAVFDPTQIKSATGNNGQFDPANADIRFDATKGWGRIEADDKKALLVLTDAQSKKDIDLLTSKLDGHKGLPAMKDKPFRAVQLPDADALEAIGEAFGVRAVGFDLTPGAPQGYDFFSGVTFKASSKAVFLGARSSRPHLALLGHETAHQLRAQRPDLYTKLVDAVSKYVDVSKYEGEFVKSAVAVNVKTAEGKQEEFIGEVLSDAFMEPTFWQTLYKESPKAFKNVYNIVLRLLQKLAGTPYAKKAAPYLTDYDRVMQIAGEVLAEIEGKPVPPKRSLFGLTFAENAQTDAAAFKKWFGDSKVVDADGKPLVVYHGTKGDIADFDASQTVDGGFHFGTAAQANMRVSGSGKNIMPIYLSAESLQRSKDLGGKWKAKIKAAKSSGHDGIVYLNRYEGLSKDTVLRLHNEGLSEKLDRMSDAEFRRAVPEAKDSYIVFRPEQIKSATGNNGNFDGNNSDIRFAVKDPAPTTPEGLTQPEQGLLRRVQSAVQDNMNRVREVQDRIEKRIGRKLPEYADYYGAETNRPGRIAARLEDSQKELVKPLMEELAKSGHTADQLDELLHAQHAEERNKKVAEINPEYKDGGSGMTNDEAKAILAKYRDNAALQSLAGKARRIARDTLDLKLAYGLIDQDAYDTLTQAYKAYVPLKGTGEYGPKIKKAMGHDAREEHIMENLVRDYELAVVAGERNLARQSLLQMVLQNPDSDLWTVGAPPKGRYIAGQSFDVYKSGKKVESFDSAAQAQAWIDGRTDGAATYIIQTDRRKFIVERDGVPVQEFYSYSKAEDYITNVKEPKGKLKIVDAGETVREFVKPLQDNEVMVYVDGRPVRIQINGDEKLAAQLRPMNQNQMGFILEKFSQLNRYLSRIYTGYSPTFLITNPLRDMQTGTITMLGNFGAGMAAKAWGQYLSAMKALFQYAKNGTEPNTEMGKMLKEYRMNGGKTGASHMSDLEEQGKTLARLYDDAYGAKAFLADGKPTKAAIVAGRKALGGMAHVIEVLNQATENGLRLALYVALRNSGESAGKAAQAAKNVTVNFDRKGSQTSVLSALFLFFNPAVQGTANAVRAIAQGDHKQQAWFALGVLAALGMWAAAQGLDGDEDRWLGEGWDTRSKKLVLNIGGTKITVPLSMEFAPFYAAGVAIEEARRGAVKPIDSAGRIISSFIDAYVPFRGLYSYDSDNKPLDAATAMVPTALRPGVEAATNRNAFGSKIVPENDFTKDRPDNLKMNRNTKGTPFDSAAQGIAAAGEVMGEGRYENGLSKVSPETLKHWWRTYTGGLGTFIGDSVGLAKLALDDPKAIEMADVPVVKAFAKGQDVSALRSRFYDLSKEIQSVAEELKQAKKAGDGESIDKIMDTPSKAELVGLEKIVTKTAQAAAKLRDEAVTINADKSITLLEKRAALKELQDQEESLYRSAISVFK